MALLRAVGQEGRDFLQSVGFDIRQGTYEEALDLLDDHYGREENIFVKTQKFCYVRQNVGKDERDYLVRVEKLSRDANLGTTDEARRRLCLVLGTNGLRDVNLRRELMARRLDWDEFARILKSRVVASQAVQLLDGTTENTSIKKEVGVVNNITRGSSRLADDYYNNNSSHSTDYVSHVERNSRDRRRDNSRERSSGYARSRSPTRRSDSDKCYVCGRSGHYKKICPEIECHNCFNKGHISRDCPAKERRNSPSYYSGYRQSGGDRSPRQYGYSSPRSGRYYSPHRSRSPGSRQRSPGYRQGSPGYRQGSPGYRQRSPGYRQRSPDYRQRSPDYRPLSPDYRKDRLNDRDECGVRISDK